MLPRLLCALLAVEDQREHLCRQRFHVAGQRQPHLALKTSCAEHGHAQQSCARVSEGLQTRSLCLHAGSMQEMYLDAVLLASGGCVVEHPGHVLLHIRVKVLRGPVLAPLDQVHILYAVRR